MEKWAVVTGASSGIGLEIARELAARGYALVLSARSAARLEPIAEELRRTHDVRTLIVPVDLGEAGGADRLVRQIAEAGVEPKVLVNNAGIGVFGPFADADPARTQEMVELNVSALTRLTALLRQAPAHILNVASTAAFQPGPGMAVYFASKAYVLSFGEALDAELAGRGVHVTTLCPGATQTGFQKRSDGEHSALFRGGMASAADVARYGVRAMERGQRVAIHGWFNWLLAVAGKWSPRRVVTAIAAWKMRPL